MSLFKKFGEVSEAFSNDESSEKVRMKSVQGAVKGVLKHMEKVSSDLERDRREYDKKKKETGRIAGHGVNLRSYLRK